MIDTFMIDTTPLEQRLEDEFPETGLDLTVRIRTTVSKLVLLI